MNYPFVLFFDGYTLGNGCTTIHWVNLNIIRHLGSSQHSDFKSNNTWNGLECMVLPSALLTLFPQDVSECGIASSKVTCIFKSFCSAFASLTSRKVA